MHRDRYKDAQLGSWPVAFEFSQLGSCDTSFWDARFSRFRSLKSSVIALILRKAAAMILTAQSSSSSTGGISLGHLVFEPGSWRLPTFRSQCGLVALPSWPSARSHGRTLLSTSPLIATSSAVDPSSVTRSRGIKFSLSAEGFDLAEAQAAQGPSCHCL